MSGLLEGRVRELIRAAPARLHWSHADSKHESVAYVCGAGETATLLHVVLAGDDRRFLRAAANIWNKAHPEYDVTRDVTWSLPRYTWSVSMDAGSVASALRDRRFRHEQICGPDVSALLREFPEDFVRDPVTAIVQQGAGDVHWPRHLSAEVICPPFRFARSNDTLVVTACRYGSRFADSGQTKTAAVFISRDAGSQWLELAWRLGFRQRFTLGLTCGSFPPEEIDHVELTIIDGEPTPVIDWCDPWIGFSAGSEWRASWRRKKRHWILETRPNTWWP